MLKKTISTFISPSPQLKDYLLKNGFKNVVCIPNFTKDEYGNPDFKKIIKNEFIYVGQIEENKGIKVLIESMKDVVKRRPDAKLKIIGRGRLEEEIKEIVKESSLEDNVELIGWVKDIRKYYGEALFVVVPSIWMEQFGLVTAEAMTSARAVIGSNRGGTPWLVRHNHDGLIFDPLKKNDLSDKIIWLLENNKTAIRFGMNGFKRIKKLTETRKNIGKLLEMYKNGEK